MKKNSKIKLYKNSDKNTSSYSISNSRKLSTSKISNNENNKYRSDKVEKKLYLNNITMKNDINLDLLSKITNTFRAYNYQYNDHDKKIESNLFNIGAQRTNLFRRSMNQVRNMIQDFDNQFSINLYNNNNNERKSTNIYTTKTIKKEPYSDYDFNLYKIYDSNNNGISNNQNLISNKNYFKEKKKGKKFLKEEKSIENELENKRKIIGLKNAFKYYELFYNYKYLLTEKDILCLRFNQRKKHDKNLKEKYLKNPRIKLAQYNKTCEKCHKARLIDKWKYKNNLKIHLFNKNLSDSNLENTNKMKLFKTELNINKNNNNENNSKHAIKRAFSGKIFKNNLIYNNSNNNLFNNFSNTITRATSASRNKELKFNKNENLNSLSASKNHKLNINISNLSSTNTPNKLNSSKKSSKIFSIKHKIQNLSNNILTTGEELKNNLEEIYQNIMEKIEQEKFPVKKIKKKLKLDIEKIRTELNLKRRGKGINEYKLIMDNVDKLYKSLPKTHVNLMRSIANLIIYEDRKKNNPLIYNDIIDNKLFKNKFKKEMFEASYKMKEIRKSLNKDKKEKKFQEKLEHLLKNDKFIFNSIKSLKDEIDKIKVFQGKIITN